VSPVAVAETVHTVVQLQFNGAPVFSPRLRGREQEKAEKTEKPEKETAGLPRGCAVG
jgi:hypothetical protein